MGFDVFGLAAKSKKGAYFHNNIAGWGPLADYVLDNVDIPENDADGWHTNSGYEISAASAAKIAESLKRLVAQGHTARYEKEYKVRLAALPLEKCDVCNGSGKRNDEFVRGKCNACQGRGERESFESNYSLEEENVRAFAEFCRNSGGFEIC